MNVNKVAGLSVLGLVAVATLTWFLIAGVPDQTKKPADSAGSSTGSATTWFQAGTWQVAIATNPSPPTVGDNTLLLDVRDAQGRPASGVNISAYAEMPAMGSMAAMRAPAGRLVESAAGHYEGNLTLDMRGEWPLTVEIQAHADIDSRRLQFDLATGRPGLSISSGGTPVGLQTASAEDANTITVNNRRRQLIGLETQTATHRDLVKKIRAVGRVSYDERLLSQITLKYDGFIGELKADYVGAEVKQGQVLFTVYSPELLAAQREYVEILKRRNGRGGTDSLLQAARQRLALWDMTEIDIKSLEQSGTAQEYMALHAPQSGTLIERNITDGSGARAGQPLLTIADLSRVWIEADVYEADLALIKVGTIAVITLPYLPGELFHAKVEYIYPYLEQATRTGRIRLTIDNAAGTLKPNMFADVSLEANLGHRLSVPEEAILVAADRRIAFVDLGAGRLKPVPVTIGHNVQGYVEIREGLELGDRVVTSGNFLIAAEARLKTGIEQW